jgi:non-ribosomal peptide synthetase component F
MSLQKRIIQEDMEKTASESNCCYWTSVKKTYSFVVYKPCTEGENMLVHHFLENSAEKYPHKGAVWYKDLWASFLDIEQNANRIANFLIARGISRGDRIGLLRKLYDYIISYFGILKAGAVVVAINNEVTSDNLFSI